MRAMAKAIPQAAANASGSSFPAAAPAPSDRAGSMRASGVKAAARETAETRIRAPAPPQKPCDSALESAPTRTISASASAVAPKAPMRLSRMISSFRSRVEPPPKPSATSASPSSCSAPVDATSAAVASPAWRMRGRPRTWVSANGRHPTRPAATPATGAAQASRFISNGVAFRPGTGSRVKKRRASATSRAADGRRRKAGLRDQRAQTNIATASTPMAAKPNSTNPHVRMSAFAAATSRPRSDRIWLLSGDMTKNA